MQHDRKIEFGSGNRKARLRVKNRRMSAGGISILPAFATCLSLGLPPSHLVDLP